MEDCRVLKRTIEESNMATRALRRSDQPLQDFPIYTISEAATYLAMPKDTLRYWVSEHPVWSIAGADLPTTLLSFRDLTQAYYVEVVRKHFNLSLSKTREVIEEAKKESKARYPLLADNIIVFYGHVIMDKKASKRQPRRFVDLTHNRQLAMREIVEPFATRLRWNYKRELVELFPWRYWTGKVEDKTRPVSISPLIMSGKLVITGTRIPVEDVVQRASEGENIANLAKDYRLPPDSIVEAMRHLVPQAT
jgi:uncharacterized protein (DUF433 family)